MVFQTMYCIACLWLSTVQTDYSLFLKKTKGAYLAVLVYVDDMLIVGDSKADIVALKQFLNSKFHMKDLGDIRYFLGLEIAKTMQGLVLCQRKYTLDLL